MPTKANDIDLNLPLSLSEETRKKFLRIKTITYRSILSNRAIAINYAKEALKKAQPGTITAEKVEEYADIMQSVARIILNQRENRQQRKRAKKA